MFSRKTEKGQLYVLYVGKSEKTGLVHVFWLLSAPKA